MVIEAQLRNHRRGHWTLQWQCPERNVWRVEHFNSEKMARDYVRLLSWTHEYKVKKIPCNTRYAQIGYWYGN